MLTLVNRASIRRNRCLYIAVTLLVALSASNRFLLSTPPVPAAPVVSGGSIDIGRLPLVFQPAVAQADPSVAFTAQAAGARLSFKASEVVLALSPVTGDKSRQGVAPDVQARSVHISFIGSNPAVTLRTGEAAMGKVSYFLGERPRSVARRSPHLHGYHLRGPLPRG